MKRISTNASLLGRGQCTKYSNEMLLGTVGIRNNGEGGLKKLWENSDGSFYKLQVVVPKNRIKEILEAIHSVNSGRHFEVNKTLQKVRDGV